MENTFLSKSFANLSLAEVSSEFFSVSLSLDMDFEESSDIEIAVSKNSLISSIFLSLPTEFNDYATGTAAFSEMPLNTSFIF